MFNIFKENKNLKSELDELIIENKNLSQKVDECKKNIENLKEENNNLEFHKNAYKSDYEILKDELADAVASFDNLNYQLNEEKSKNRKLSSSIGGFKSNYNKKIKALKNEATFLKVERDLYLSTNSNLIEEIKKLKLAIKELKHKDLTIDKMKYPELKNKDKL